MAKITKYKKDTIGQQMLLVAAFVLIVWFVIAGLNISHPLENGQVPPASQQADENGGSGAIWYYLGVPVVSVLWGLANYERNPVGYGSKRAAAVISLMTGAAMGFTVWLFAFAARNPDLLSELLLGP